MTERGSQVKKKRTATEIEVLETRKLFLSFERLVKATRYGGNARVKRALYHALLMSGFLTSEQITEIRQALLLP